MNPLSEAWRTYGGGVADAAGGTADFVNQPINALFGLAGTAYRLPTNALQAAVPQPVGAVNQLARTGTSLAIPLPGGKAGAAGKVVRPALDAIERAAAERGVSVSLGAGTRGITLSKIVVPKEARGAGLGSDIMRQILDVADQTGQRIMLTPDGSFGGSVSRLKQFYARHGFVPNAGRTKDFSISEAMYRDPRARP